MQGSRAKRYATIAATFGFALGIGFLMQNGDAVASRLGVDTTNDTQKDAADHSYVPVRASGMTPVAVPDMSATSPEEGAAAGCEIGFDATPGMAAMVTLSLFAPCHPETLVTVQHQGMKFHAYTDDAGLMIVDVPALAQEAYFVATVDKQAGHAAITGVPDLAMYDRAVLQWRGGEDLQLHALEFDSSPGEDGHVWKAAHRMPEDSTAGEAGFLTVLGSTQSPAPLMVQIYSYPTGMSTLNGHVALSVQTEITAENCGGILAAQSIQLRPDHPPAARNMSMRVPGCDRVGEILVLKNMFEDLTLAAR